MTELFTLVLGLCIGLGLRRYRTDVIQNRGEASVSEALINGFASPDYHLLSHVTLSVDGVTTQIDQILVSRFGIFVIETKAYNGWIFGNAGDAQWTQVLYRAKFRFRNPIRQNYRHVCAVRALLDFLPPDAVQSMVVFVGDAQFKTAIPEGVYSLVSCLAYIESQTTPVLSENRLQFCVGRLETMRLSLTKVTDIAHVQQLRRRFGNFD